MLGLCFCTFFGHLSVPYQGMVWIAVIASDAGLISLTDVKVSASSVPETFSKGWLGVGLVTVLFVGKKAYTFGLNPLFPTVSSHQRCLQTLVIFGNPCVHDI